MYLCFCRSLGLAREYIFASREGFSFSSLLSTPDSMSACGVEGGAAVGAWFFFSGSLLLLLNASAFTLVLLLWVLGSLAFTLGGVSLTARHFILNLT